jgi:hypothetical protein
MLSRGASPPRETKGQRMSGLALLPPGFVATPDTDRLRSQAQDLAAAGPDGLLPPPGMLAVRTDYGARPGKPLRFRVEP